MQSIARVVIPPRRAGFSPWTRSRDQRLVIAAVPSGLIRLVRDGFRVLELREFHEGTVNGIDSPAYLPQAFELVVDEAEHGQSWGA